MRIVENDAVQATAWQVDAAAVFAVGWDAEGPMFTWPQSGRILPDGGALIGEFSEGTIYRIAPDGSVAATWGRKGEGPGEYQAFDAILLHGDSILVSDGRLRRITWLSSEGELLSTRSKAGGFLHRVSAITDDGRLLLVPGGGYSAVDEIRQEWVFETQPILSSYPEGSRVDTLAVLPYLRRWYGSRAAPPGAIRVAGAAGGYPGGFAWARADRPEVRWFDASGELTQIARWNEEAEPFTAEFRSRFLDFFAESAESVGRDEASVAAQRMELEENLDRHDGPLPYWDSFFVDREGNTWTRRYGLPLNPAGEWRIVTRDGELLGWIDLPGVVAILDASDDHVLVALLGELDVSAVALFRIDKGG
ncbi:hypothetical protein V3331_13280 [Gaopeijia maritima]|uniref:hypothetical protein n=1 Tax=Gaopeijia maritima TaxID=3119007 RepID=UPI003250E138